MKLEYSRCLYLRADIDERREREKRSKRFSLNPAWKQRSITNKALKTQNETVAENRRCMRTNNTSSPQKQGTSGAPFQIQEQERRDRREKEREWERESTKTPGEITKIRSVMETLTRETKSPLKRSSKDEEEKATLTCAIDNNMMGSVQQAASTAIRRGFMVTVYLAVRSATHLSCQAGASLPTASFSLRRAR